MKSKIGAVVMITVVMAIGTVFGGWWIIPVCAFGAGYVTPSGTRSAALIGLCAALAWSGLLALQGAGGVAVGDVATKVGQLFSLPKIGFTLLAPVFAFLVGWSVAALGEEIGVAFKKAPV